MLPGRSQSPDGGSEGIERERRCQGLLEQLEALPRKKSLLGTCCIAALFFIVHVLTFGGGSGGFTHMRGGGGQRWWMQHRYNSAMDEWVPAIRDDVPASLALASDRERGLAQSVEASLVGRPRVAIVSFFLAEPKGGASRYNILPAMSHRECYCARHGYSCHTELLALSDRLLGTNRVHFNKQLVVRKYLPFYDLVLFADSDVYFNMNRRVEDVVEEGRAIYFSPSQHPDNFFGAGVFLMTNSPASFAFLGEWFDYALRPELMNDSDNGILHYILAARLPDYDHSCDHEATDLKHSIKPCLERFLGRPDLDFGEIRITPRLAIPARSTVADANSALEEGEGALCVHGHSVGTYFSSSRELYNCSAYALEGKGSG